MHHPSNWFFCFLGGAGGKGGGGCLFFLECSWLHKNSFKQLLLCHEQSQWKKCLVWNSPRLPWLWVWSEFSPPALPRHVFSWAARSQSSPPPLLPEAQRPLVWNAQMSPVPHVLGVPPQNELVEPIQAETNFNKKANVLNYWVALSMETCTFDNVFNCICY